MNVINSLTNESVQISSAWKERIQIIIPIDASAMYIREVKSNASASDITYGSWQTVLTDKSGATKAYVDDLIKKEYVSSVISSMTGNSNTTVSIPLTIPTGYVAIGCLQTLTSTRSAAITGNFINAADSTLKMNCVNLYSADLSNVTVGATVAYIRS
jgi:hypothetical protein